MRQGDCHACLGQNREAVRAFGEGLKRAETDEDKASVLSQIISMAVNLEGLCCGAIPITAAISHTRPSSNDIFSYFESKFRWSSIKCLIVLFSWRQLKGKELYLSV